MKRHASLAALSRDHHHALVLAQSMRHDAPPRLREGWPAEPAAQIAALQERFARELEPHFEVEERVLLPVSAEGMAERIRADHDALRRAFAELTPEGLADALDRIGELLTEHVRHEERVWFPALEQQLGDEALAALQERLRPTPLAAISGFHRDEAGDWVAELDCGHAQHVRHRPPWELREWVTSESGRSAHLGERLPCLACRMPRLPARAREYKRTAELDEHTLPAGLTRSHRLKAEAWAEIVVLAGSVLYVLEDEGDLGFVLAPGRPGTVAPERPHHIELRPGARLYLRFLRCE